MAIWSLEARPGCTPRPHLVPDAGLATAGTGGKMPAWDRGRGGCDRRPAGMDRGQFRPIVSAERKVCGEPVNR
jgi:hypothetical protein